MKELLGLPKYVYPACMVVFGYPTKQQKERKKPQRFALTDIVYENTYQDKSSEEIRSMFTDKTGDKVRYFWGLASRNKQALCILPGA